MAIKSTRLQAEYRKALNRINSGFERTVPVVDGDQYLNEAIDIIFENFAARFEENTLIRNHLRQLEIPNKKLSLVEDGGLLKAELPDNDYYMCTRQFGVGVTDKCDEQRIIDLYMIQTSDITNSLKDPFWKPSFAWEEALIQEAGNHLVIYPGDIKFEEVIIDYLRKPKHIATPSKVSKGQTYINAEGETLTEDIDLEIDSTFFWRKVVRLAAINTLRDLGDIQNYQAQLQSIMTFDKIFLK